MKTNLKQTKTFCNQKLLEQVAGESWILILWNDDINDMMHVSVCLYQLCELSNKKATAVMYEAHNNGQAFVREGKKERLAHMQYMMKQHGLTTSLVREGAN